MTKSSAKNDDAFEKQQSVESAEFDESMDPGYLVGIRYSFAANLRRKRKLDKWGRAFLKKFDADQKKILRDPESVWQEGLKSALDGIELIETLIRERRGQNISGKKDTVLDDAVRFLSWIAFRLQNDIIHYAEEGMPWACHAIFRDGKALASAFSRLAIACPEHFQPLAERSLTMPSLRARDRDFTCDAEAIIRAIHLAEKHHAANIHDNRSRIGALCHQFVAEIVDQLVASHLEARQKGETNSEYYNLPELKWNAKAWWKAGLKERVHLEFERMRKNPRHNPALWQELDKITDHGSPSAMRAAFEKYCFNKLEQIAGKSVLPMPTV